MTSFIIMQPEWVPRTVYTALSAEVFASFFGGGGGGGRGLRLCHINGVSTWPR